MVYVEEKIVNGNIYYYHSKNFRINNKIKKLSIYIGKDKKLANNYNEILKSIKKLSLKQSELFLSNLNVENYSFSKQSIRSSINYSIYYFDLKEFDKNLGNELNLLFNLNFIYNSNSIEGSRIPFDDVKRIMNKQKITYKNKNEIREVMNSINCQIFLENEFKFNLKSIKKLHELLTTDLYHNNDPYKQGFKKSNIVVGHDSRPTTDPKDVKNELKKLLIWYKNIKSKEFGIKVAFDFYFKFELIHPFEDGNGRCGRMLMNKILKDLKFEPMIIFKENSQSHHRAFVRGEKGSMKYYYDFMFKQYRKTFTNFYDKY